MKNIETKGNFSIERMDEWVVAEIFHWVGDVCVSLMLQFCQCLVKPNVCECVCFLCCNFFGVLRSQMCVPKRIQKMLLLYLGLYNGYQSKGRILIDNWTDGLFVAEILCKCMIYY